MLTSPNLKPFRASKRSSLNGMDLQVCFGGGQAYSKCCLGAMAQYQHGLCVKNIWGEAIDRPSQTESVRRPYTSCTWRPSGLARAAEVTRAQLPAAAGDPGKKHPSHLWLFPKKGGPQYRPQTTIIPIMGIPKWYP